MQINPIASAGYVQAVRRFDASAQRVARAGAASGDVDLAVEAIEQIGATRAASANLAAQDTANEQLKRLLDIKV
jgi:hypothetical protein